MDDREFTLDYVCIDRVACMCGGNSDHAAVSVSIEWKIS